MYTECDMGNTEHAISHSQGDDEDENKNNRD